MIKGEKAKNRASPDESQGREKAVINSVILEKLIKLSEPISSFIQRYHYHVIG